MFPKFSVDGLVDGPDLFWAVKESKKEVGARARKVLERVFVDENKDKKCKIHR
jgi:hypothetical protein